MEGARPRGRPKKTWREIVEKDCKACGLNMEDAMDRSRWRKQIGMIDDHDECEWVNVSSGTGSPGLSRTKSTERKTVVCMCVCVNQCNNKADSSGIWAVKLFSNKLLQLVMSAKTG